ncbi:RagB/SusD family nutrient uptake outer membrane protein [Sphingobacterium sp.]|uniref:RagB/SusD family nutrient uptake outer membrane protein n=1 Tax=Sphingobacterium sp. TaxID=341027 RepID=UPI0028AFF71D|nr:RagB/SusD family nutrient uptake outer membrane protein [Sphingobacterium sp.]
MKIKYLSINLIAFCLFAISCNKIELEPISSISDKSFWKTENDAQGALNGLYFHMRSVSSQNLYLWGEGRSEILGSSITASQGYDIYYNNTLNATVTGPNWQSMYLIVHDANLIIKNVPNISFINEANKNLILGQAYAARAWSYFVMTKTWGALPLVLEPTTGNDPNRVNQKRASQKEIFSSIKSDVEKALSFIPINEFTQGKNVWSRPAIQALKAEVFLWSGKLLQGGENDVKTALNAISEVEKSKVALMANFSDVFSFSNKNNQEIIFSLSYNSLEPTRSTIFSWMYANDGYFPANLTDADTKQKLGVLGGGYGIAPSSVVRNQFQPDDSRKNATFLEIYVTQDGIRKFHSSVNMKFRGTVLNGAREYIDDYILYRYADILLMKAEAKNYLNQDPTEEINAIRKRAYGVEFNKHIFVNKGKDINDIEILKERLFELMFEGKRWWDLIRFNKGLELVPAMKGKTSDHLLWPISQETLSLEPGVEQNPGY